MKVSYRSVFLSSTVESSVDSIAKVTKCDTKVSFLDPQAVVNSGGKRSDSSSLSAGAIAGIVIACLIVVGVVVVAAVLWRQQHDNAESKHGTDKKSKTNKTDASTRHNSTPMVSNPMYATPDEAERQSHT